MSPQPEMLEKKKMGHGGARPGAGKPKGVKWPKTIEKEEARTALRAMVTAALEPMTLAQIANACGIKFLMVREKQTGKFLKVGKDAAEKLNPDEEIIEVWEEKPNVQAFTDLLNRTLDKPTEHVDMKATISDARADRIVAARNRANGKR